MTKNEKQKLDTTKMVRKYAALFTIVLVFILGPLLGWLFLMVRHLLDILILGPSLLFAISFIVGGSIAGISSALAIGLKKGIEQNTDAEEIVFLKKFIAFFLIMSALGTLQLGVGLCYLASWISQIFS